MSARDGRFGAAIELASRSPAAFRRTARRYSLCSQDAEDAYQRGLEILLTKAPTEDRAQLRPWLHTVIKHEALAIRGQRERLLGSDASVADTTPGPDESAPERERARHTVEALGYLKQSEVQCMLLKALGYSYAEIGQRTGYSRTKVNRSLTEGRKHFFDRFGQISTGASCSHFESLLEAEVADEAPPTGDDRLRAHLRSCAVCRASLRERRATAPRSAELLSPAMLLPALRGSWWSRLHDSVAGSLSERVTAVGAKLQQTIELATAHKVAAVAASTAALAGGAAAEQHTHGHPAPRDAQARQGAIVQKDADSTQRSEAAPEATTPSTRGVPRTDAREPAAESDSPTRASEFAVGGEEAANDTAQSTGHALVSSSPGSVEPPQPGQRESNHPSKEFMP